MSRRISFIALFLSLTAPGLLGACEQKAESAPAAVSKPDGIYRLRGVIKALPSTPKGKVTVSHEAIPGFTNKAGKQTGMMAMTMQFVPVGDLPEGLKVGDKVAFDYQVRFEGKPMNAMAKVEKLPADTELKLAE